MNRNERTLAMLEKIHKLEIELNSLYTSSFEISELYNDVSFLGKEKLVVSLENSLIAATHESATQIGFFRRNCAELVSFIEFREKYNYLSDIELQEIIDNTSSLNIKKKILSKAENVKQVVELISNIRFEWNAKFENKGYLYFKEKHKI